MFSDLTVERFWRKTAKRSDNDCWLWTGTKHRKDGRAIMSANGRSVRASHVALFIKGSEKPTPDHMACHTCDNPSCVNPLHLWWGTASENSQDSVKKGRHAKIRLTHCANGHPYSKENTEMRIDRKNERRCKICRHEQNVRNARERRERILMQNSNGEGQW